MLRTEKGTFVNINDNGGAASKKTENTNTEQPASESTSSKAWTTKTTGTQSTSPQAAAVETVQKDVQSEYERLLEAAQAVGSAPVYTDKYDSMINDLYAQITGRGSFRYNLNEDALWQQYQDQYTQMGKQAARDTMGQAAALTGGYGSSYGQAVAQQQYDQYLKSLGDVVPELYESAYQKWSDEGDRMLEQYSMLQDLSDRDYQRYQDEYNQWLTERSYADAKAADALSRQSSNLDMLQYLIGIGYTPTAQEIADAGLTQAQYAAMLKYKQEQDAAAANTYTYDPTPPKEEEVEEPTESKYGRATYERLGYNLSRNIPDTERADILAEGVANGYIGTLEAEKYIKQYGLEDLFG